MLNGMQKDFSWSQSAAQYEQLYRNTRPSTTPHYRYGRPERHSHSR